MEQLTKDIRSLDMWSRIIKANNAYQNKGLLRLEMDLQEIIQKENFPKIKLIQFTILMKYEVIKPIAGLKFHTFESEGKQKICIFNENKVQSKFLFLSLNVKSLVIHVIGFHV